MLRNRKLITLIIFILSFSFMIYLKSSFVNLSKIYLVYINQRLIDKWVNEVYIFEKKAEIYIDKDDFIRVNCKYFNTKEGNIEKYVLIDTFNEFALPLIIILAFAISIAYYLRFKFKFIFTTLILSIITFSIKITLIVFDNYNYQQYQLSEFSFPLKQIIYYFNKILNITGSSLNFVIIVLILLSVIGLFYKQAKFAS